MSVEVLGVKTKSSFREGTGAAGFAAWSKYSSRVVSQPPMVSRMDARFLLNSYAD